MLALIVTGGASAPATARSLSYASSGGYLVITSHASLLEEYLRSSETPVKPLRDTPGLSDAEIVSNISNYLVSPLGFSQIR